MLTYSVDSPGQSRGISPLQGGGDEGLKVEGGFTFGRLQRGFKGASRGLEGGCTLKGASSRLEGGFKALKGALTGLEGGLKGASSSRGLQGGLKGA